MAHLQYIPGDPRLVDQLVYELKSKGIFDQFRKDCIADVDTRPAYQNLRQRVENSVSTFLSRQCWKPDLNKNQLREKLRKHILDGNYLEQGVERIVDQVVNPKVASVFIPQVEDLVYNYLGITRKKTTPVAETSNGKVTENDLLPTDLEAVSPGSVKSNDDKNESMEMSIEVGDDSKMEMDTDKPKDEKDNTRSEIDKDKTDDTRLSGVSELTSNDSIGSIDISNIPFPSEEIKLENIPAPDNSPPISTKVKVELEKIELPQECNPNLSDIPLPDETPKSEKETYFKPVNSDDDDSSSDSSLRRNMSPLTPIRNFNNENSCDAQQAFENEDNKEDKNDTLEPSTFRFTIESKETENSSDSVKTEKKETEQANLSYQFNSQVNINTFNTPLYDDSSNSTHLQIDYESDANSKTNAENKIPEPDLNSGDSRKDKKSEEKKSSHKSSHQRDSHRHSSSKDRRSDSKQSSSKDSKSDRKSSKDDHKSSSKSSHKERSSERDKKDEKKDRDSSKHRSSHKSSSSSTHKDSKSHRSSSSSQRHSSSSKHTDEKRSSSSSHRDKSERSSDKYSKEKSSKESKSSSSSHRSDKDRKSSSSSKSKSDDKERQKKDKKETDDHYSASGRGNHTRRSTDRDSNDGSSSSKGSHHPTSSKSSEIKKENKGSTSKSESISTSGDSTSPSDKDHVVTEKSKNEPTNKNKDVPQVKPVVRIENHLETPISSPPRLPFVPDVTLKKPKFAANMQEAKKLMKMRKFLDEEQKRMNQEAALLLEFQANVRPSLSQVYSSIPGPELEFACVTNNQREMIIQDNQIHSDVSDNVDNSEPRNDTISDILTAAQQVENIEVSSNLDDQNKEAKSERQEISLKNVPAEFEGVVVEGEIDDEANQQSDTATVQIENIIEADITSCEMDVDTTIDDKKIQIIDSISADLVEHSKNIFDGDEYKVKSDVIKNEETTGVTEIQGDEMPDNDGIEARLQSLMEDNDDNKRSEYFQVTIITEELSETEDIDDKTDTITEVDKPDLVLQIEEEICSNEPSFEYFAEHEKYNAELEKDRFSKFLKSFTERSFTNKLHVINCDSYEESIIKEVSQNFGEFEIVNYYKNGHLKLNTAKNIVRNINVSSEISLPVDKVCHKNPKTPSPMFSPVKSECSFELSSDYDAKLEEMVSKTSRKEIMEIILGNMTDESTSESSEMPTIDYCMESNIDTENTMKRKFCEVESSVNNNRQVLTPNKIRKLSGSDQISSTTEESEETSNNNVTNPMRSKYLGRARRVGLPRPRRSNLPNSPSSDKSVENYEQNSQSIGRLKPRKVQRYDTSDLYKPKLHYLSRRNNIS